MQVVIPCPHQVDALGDHKQQVPNHYPLNMEQIGQLLEEAKTSTEPLTSRILVRLCQGIPGYVCPRVIESAVTEKEYELSVLFTENFHRGADPELIDQLYNMMR